MGENEDKENRKSQKNRKQSEKRGVSPEGKEPMVEMICGKDTF